MASPEEDLPPAAFPLAGTQREDDGKTTADDDHDPEEDDEDNDNDS